MDAEIKDTEKIQAVKKYKNNRLLSKALFKQSCKANGMMWLIITVAVCFMLACVMLISGTSNISSVKENIENTIIEEAINSSVSKGAVSVYDEMNEGEYLFDRTFAEKFNELNTEENYRKIAEISDKATADATALVKEKVTEKVTAEVTDRLTAQVKNRVTELITAEVTSRLSSEVQAKVTEMVTAEVTSRIQAEITARVQSEAGTIQAEITDAVTQDMAASEAAGKIAEKMKGGKDQTAATNEVIAEYTAVEKEKITNEHIAAATASFTTEEHKNAVSKQVLAEKQSEYTENAKSQIITEAHKTEVTNAVLSEKQDAYTKQATAEIVTDTQKSKTAEEVLSEYQEQYTEEAQNELKDKIDGIKNQAEDEVTELFTELYVKPAYEAAANAVIDRYTEECSALVAINPNNKADSVYTENGEEIPPEYIENLLASLQDDVQSAIDGNKSDSLSDYIASDERSAFRNERAYAATSMLVAQNMTSDDTVNELLDALADYNVTREGYEKMGFDYAKVHTTAYEAAMEYQDKLSYEMTLIQAEAGTDAYDAEIASIKESLNVAVAGSLLEKLPEDVADGLEELGRMDLYGLIVGSIFFKMAGLLLPIIYLIMASNNLIAGQVDSGSMAYVLSTSTKRRQVTYTQGIYLIGSLLLMFICTAITSVVCFGMTDVQTNLTNEKLLEINLGAFVVLFAMSGINFLASCWFDRSKKAMALGGGISMFFLVATMLGLFGSPVIPSVVRIGALNNFNYVSIISLFDVVSILDETNVWLWKLGILLAIGITGYILGDIKFRKKDLPL